MSEQTEKEILKILKNQEKVLEKHGKMLEKLEKGQERLELKQEKLEKGQEKLERGQKEQQEFNKNVLERFKNQEEFNMRILELFENLKDEVLGTRNELIKFSNYFTAFEYDINRKVDLLLENYDFDRKQLMKYDKDIFNLRKHSFNHEERISSLELKATMP